MEYNYKDEKFQRKTLANIQNTTTVKKVTTKKKNIKMLLPEKTV